MSVRSTSSTKALFYGDFFYPAYEVNPLNVEFREDTSQTYGFDNFTDSLVPWKSVEKNQSDTALAQINSPVTTYFESADIGKVTVSPEESNASSETLTLDGVAAGETDIQAKPEQNGDISFATMNVAVYEKITKSLAIVYVNEDNDDVQEANVGETGIGANEIVISNGDNGFRDTIAESGDDEHDSGITAGSDGDVDTTANDQPVYYGPDISMSSLKNYLNNQVFNQCVVFFERVENPLTMLVNYDLDRDGKLESKFGDETHSIRNAFEQTYPMHGDFDYVVFVVNDIDGGEATGAFTKLNWKYIYVQTKNASESWLINTIAHELGHSYGGFQDIENCGIDDDNIMSFCPDGENWRLRYDQWHEIQK